MSARKKKPAQTADKFVICYERGGGYQAGILTEDAAIDVAKGKAAELPGQRVSVYKLVTSYISDGVREERPEN